MVHSSHRQQREKIALWRIPVWRTINKVRKKKMKKLVNSNYHSKTTITIVYMDLFPPCLGSTVSDPEAPTSTSSRHVKFQASLRSLSLSGSSVNVSETSFGSSTANSHGGNQS